MSHHDNCWDIVAPHWYRGVSYSFLYSMERCQCPALTLSEPSRGIWITMPPQGTIPPSWPFHPKNQPAWQCQEHGSISPLQWYCILLFNPLERSAKAQLWLYVRFQEFGVPHCHDNAQWYSLGNFRTQIGKSHIPKNMVATHYCRSVLYSLKYPIEGCQSPALTLA